MSRFWGAKDTAGPGAWDVARLWDREPRYMRTQNRACPGPFQDIWRQPTYLLPVHAALVLDFWNAEYGGRDWKMMLGTPDLPWITHILADPACLALGVFGEDGRTLVATIVCRSLVGADGEFIVGSRGRLDTAYIIEGLCVARTYRGRHLAGWLIAWVDYLKCRQRPHAFLWSREAALPTAMTHIATAQYAYVRSEDLLERPEMAAKIEEMPWVNFAARWAASAPSWLAEKAVFPTSLPPPPPASLKVFQSGAQIVVVADTRRVTKAAGREEERMWEVVWCGADWSGYERSGYDRIAPAGQVDVGSFRVFLEALAKHALGEKIMLFAADAAHLGGAESMWGSPWVFGRSGHHLTYIYNFMPPAFGCLGVLMPWCDL